MRNNLITLFILFLLLGVSNYSINAQVAEKATTSKDSVGLISASQLLSPASILTKKQKDSLWLSKHIPQRATRRSAMIPGWGQAYNREYWKIPLAWGVIAIPAVTYFYNNDYYKKTKFAYEARYNAQLGDSSAIAAIDPELVNLSIYSLQNYRNMFRRNRDYSILLIILAWGLQVVDATVFGHLKHFNVSDNLSMQIHPQINPITKSPVLTMSIGLKDPVRKPKNIGK
jgi:hypothetical protein